MLRDALGSRPTEKERPLRAVSVQGVDDVVEVVVWAVVLEKARLELAMTLDIVERRNLRRSKRLCWALCTQCRQSQESASAREGRQTRTATR